MIADPLAVFVVLAAVVFLSIVLEKRVRAVAAVGSVLTAIILSAVLSNLGVLPAQSSTYGVLGGVGINLGIALILLGVDVRSVLRAGPAMLTAWALGGLGTVLGAIGATALLSGAIGPEAWKIAGQYTGTYIGGGVNMVAVGRGVETSPELFTAAVAADNVTTAVWMATCLSLPLLLRRFWVRRGAASDGTVRRSGNAPEGETAVDASSEFSTTSRPVTLLDLATVFLIAAVAIWVSERLTTILPGIPAVLWLTTLTLMVAQLPPVRRLSGGPVAGYYLLHLFLATLGAQSIIAEIVRVGPAVFYFTLIVVGVHGLLLFGVGRALRIDLGTLVVASQANVGGPASAMAVATARGYHDLVVPGVAVGLLGYAVGNYAGFAVAGVLRTLFVG